MIMPDGCVGCLERICEDNLLTKLEEFFEENPEKRKRFPLSDIFANIMGNLWVFLENEMMLFINLNPSCQARVSQEFLQYNSAMQALLKAAE